MSTTTVTRRIWLAVTTGLFFTSALAVEGDSERGAVLSATCAACHQANGSGMNNPTGESWPRLAGLDAGYLARQLHDFKTGQRVSASMTPFVSALDDQQIADLAIYYSEMATTPAQSDEAIDVSLLARGEQLANRGDWSTYIVSCSSCHGPDGAGVGSQFPAIASQHAGYISSQLHAWRKGERRNDPQNLMSAIAKRMSDEDIQAVSVWYARQSLATGEEK